LAAPEEAGEPESQSSGSDWFGIPLVIHPDSQQADDDSVGQSSDTSSDTSSDAASQSDESTADSGTPEQEQSDSVDETQVDGDVDSSTTDLSPATPDPSTPPEPSPSDAESPTPPETESTTPPETESPTSPEAESTSAQPPVSPEVSPEVGVQVVDASDGRVSVEVDDVTANRYTGLAFQFFVNGAAVKLADWPADCTFDGFTAACGTRQDPFSETFDLELAGAVADGQPLTVMVAVSASGVAEDAAETSDTVTVQPTS